MLALNPQVMDFMAAARGYSLGLAGLAGGHVRFSPRPLPSAASFDPEDKEWRWGCAVASIGPGAGGDREFSRILFPPFAWQLLSASSRWVDLALFFQLRDRAVREFAKYFILPGTAVGFCILWPYLLQARLAQSKIQMDTAANALRDIFDASFLYKWTDDLFNSLGAMPAAAGRLARESHDPRGVSPFAIALLFLC